MQGCGDGVDTDALVVELVDGGVAFLALCGPSPLWQW
jgi:hypothetical protein